MFGLVAKSKHARLTVVKLFSKNSNLCDHNSPTLQIQTDRRTDRQTTCDRNTALCTKVHRAVIKLLIKICNISNLLTGKNLRQELNSR